MVVELPAGVPMLYPSALFYHFNADIAGKSFFFFHTAHDGNHYSRF